MKATLLPLLLSLASLQVVFCAPTFGNGVYISQIALVNPQSPSHDTHDDETSAEASEDHPDVMKLEEDGEEVIPEASEVDLPVILPRKSVYPETTLDDTTAVEPKKTEDNEGATAEASEDNPAVTEVDEPTEVNEDGQVSAEPDVSSGDSNQTSPSPAGDDATLVEPTKPEVTEDVEKLKPTSINTGDSSNPAKLEDCKFIVNAACWYS